jgi:hypothetical protein
MSIAAILEDPPERLDGFPVAIVSGHGNKEQHT